MWLFCLLQFRTSFEEFAEVAQSLTSCTLFVNNLISLTFRSVEVRQLYTIGSRVVKCSDITVLGSY